MSQGSFDLDKPILVKYLSGVSYEGLYANMPQEMRDSTAHVFTQPVCERSGR